MEVINGSKYAVKVNQIPDKNGDLHLLAVVKATYDFPENNDQRLVLSEVQNDILTTDIDDGEEDISIPRIESNMSGIKPKCDVVLKATGYPPVDHDDDKFEVAFKVANCEKKLWIQGEQTWYKNALGQMVLSAKQPLAPTPISYARSYGGSWVANEEQDESFNDFFMQNPIGIGYAKPEHKPYLDGKLAPNIFPENDKMNASKAFNPASFSSIGRHWYPRTEYAGTYDQDWKDNVFPRLPADFDERFFQSVPEDQQIDYPTGRESIELFNMHPTRPHISFKLPNLSLIHI